MPYSQKYCLVAFNSPVQVNTEFHTNDWPLHVTLADVFAINLTKDIKEKLAEMLANQPRFIIHAGKESILGVTKVVLFDNNNKINNLHHLLIDLLESNGAVFNNPEFTKEGFVPHCTIQKTTRLNQGDILKIDTISLVDMFPENNWQQRRVLYNFKLQ